MSIVSQISSPVPQWEDVQKPKERIRLQIYSDSCSPECVVNNLASIEGPIDIYCWYEGSQCLPQLGANFMKTSIFEPLYKLKDDAKLYLYSLKAWDFKKSVSKMSSTTPLGEAINRIYKAAIECIYSSSFFQYCTKIRKENGIYEFLNAELPKKKWLRTLSEDQKKKAEDQKKKGTTIAELFSGKASLFDSIKDLEVSAAYSTMQYVEGYYLIQESVRKGLLNGQKKIQIAFVLANDESKFYLDYPKDIEKMLRLDFGKELSGVDVDISFRFFEYGDSLDARPYTDKRRNAPKVEAADIGSYFDYLSKPSGEQSIMSFLRDIIHNINGWNMQ